MKSYGESAQLGVWACRGKSASSLICVLLTSLWTEEHHSFFPKDSWTPGTDTSDLLELLCLSLQVLIVSLVREVEGITEDLINTALDTSVSRQQY